MIKVNKWLFCFPSQNFCKFKEDILFSVFLSSYKNTCESLKELERAVVTLACRIVVKQHFLFSQTSTLSFCIWVETQYVYLYMFSIFEWHCVACTKQNLIISLQVPIRYSCMSYSVAACTTDMVSH